MIFFRKFGTFNLILAASLVLLDVYFAAGMAGLGGGRMRENSSGTREYFLSAAEGGGELVMFPDDVKILIDAGPAGSAAASALAAILPSGDRYIDIAISSYPSARQSGGFTEILDDFRIGTFLWSGRRPAGPGAASWGVLRAKLASKGVPVAVVGAHDRIKTVSGEIAVLSPESAFLKSPEPREASLVLRVEGKGAAEGQSAAAMTSIFMGGADLAVERYLAAAESAALRADILKTADAGGSLATGASLLRDVRPEAVIVAAGGGTGAGKAAAGAPARSLLGRIASSTPARVFRTDTGGMIEIWRRRGGALEAARARK